MAAEPTQSRPSSRFWRTLILFDASKIAPDIAIRNTIGIVVPLIAGALIGNVSVGRRGGAGRAERLVLGQPRPLWHPARRMLGASVLVGLAVFLGALSGHSNAAAVIVGSLWAFGAGMLVVLGVKAGNLRSDHAGDTGGIRRQAARPDGRRRDGLVAFAGALLQTALAIAFWPVRPYGPQRRIIGALYMRCRKWRVPSRRRHWRRRPARNSPKRAKPWPALGDHAAETERYVSLLSLAERIRLSLLMLRRLRARLGRDARGREPADAVGRVLTAASERRWNRSGTVYSTKTRR